MTVIDVSCTLCFKELLISLLRLASTDGHTLLFACADTSSCCNSI